MHRSRRRGANHLALIRAFCALRRPPRRPQRRLREKFFRAVETASCLPLSASRWPIGATKADVEWLGACSHDALKVPNSSALLRFRYLFDENAAAEAAFAAACVRWKHFPRRRGSANASLYTKLSGAAVNFFPLVYFGCSADRFATALHR
jgi:hypothetical protein